MPGAAPNGRSKPSDTVRADFGTGRRQGDATGGPATTSMAIPKGHTSGFSDCANHWRSNRSGSGHWWNPWVALVRICRCKRPRISRLFRMECFMSVLNPIELFAQTIHMLANADCPQCRRKDGSALAPGRKESGDCEWCLGRHRLLDQSKQWLQRSGMTAERDRPRPETGPRHAAGR